MVRSMASTSPGDAGKVAIGGRWVVRVGDPTLIVPSDVRDCEGDAADELAAVEERLGRPARGSFAVVVRDAGDGAPVVIRNEPLLADGTPMPTRYWLVDPELLRRIGRIENSGGVRASEAEVDPGELRAAHDRYAAERDSRVPADWTGPRPSGGVGGTRQGVKCLHTHYANWLVVGDDPVGAWVHARLDDPPPAVGAEATPTPG